MDHAGNSSSDATPSESAVLILDLDGRLTQWSADAAREFGLSAEEALGRDVGDLLARGEDRATVQEALTAARSGSSWSGALAAACGGGRIREFEFRCRPVVDATGRTSVLVCAARSPLPQPDPGKAVSAGGSLALLQEASSRIGSTLELERTASEVMSVAVPRLATAAGIFVLERLVADEEFPERETDGSVVVRKLAAGLGESEPGRWAGVLPEDEVMVYPAGSPYAQCVASGEPIVCTVPDRRGAIRVGDVDDEGAAGSLLDRHVGLLMPLKARGNLLGFVVFIRERGNTPFSRQETLLAEGVAARAAVCIDNARLFTRERRAARTLQSGLMPGELSVPARLTIAHRYMPVGDEARLGGDWYDAVALSGGRVSLVIGDAMGHGTAAAAAMCQLRIAVRTLAGLDIPPEEVLTRLDRMAQELDAAQFATCLYLTMDPAERSCVLACAGHPPPILARGDGTTDVLELPPGLPLGIGGAAFESTEVKIPRDSTLALYTDGLVESRERDLDAGTAALRAILAQPQRSLERTCDDVITGLGREHAADDVSLLLVRIDGEPDR